MPNYNERALDEHQKNRGKLEVRSLVSLDTREDLATYYTPGVAEPCRHIAANPDKAYDYTWKSRTVAVISDGSAVLGLGNIGGLAGLPVMEGKAILFKEFADVDAIPIVLASQDVDSIVNTIVNIAPSFGGINLEDIKAPECFAIEEQLKQKTNIPIFHDDQHGTAIVILAGLINAFKITDKDFSTSKIIIAGAGAAGIATAKLLAAYGATNVILIDSRGAVYKGRDGLNAYKVELAYLNKNNESGLLQDLIQDADVFIGLSGQPDSLTIEDVHIMNENPIIFALSNPDPEFDPALASEAGVAVMATGRSDYPNQLNNVLVFPGLFRGVLDARIPEITDEHKLSAAEALASYVKNPRSEEIIPSPFDPEVSSVVAEAVKKVG